MTDKVKQVIVMRKDNLFLIIYNHIYNVYDYLSCN
jgi:hypothetical protein